MIIERFEDIIAWNKGQKLAVHINEYLWDLKDFAFKNQITKAAVSISNNIAEGFERETDKKFKRLFYIVKGSYGKLRSMIYLAFNLGYISNNTRSL